LRSIAAPAFHRGVSLGNTPVIELRNVSCARTETGISSAVHDVSIELRAGTVTQFSGDRGCGKNLILRILGLLETPDCGQVFFDGEAVQEMTPEQILDLRMMACGYVFAPPFLLPQFTVLENIAMPLFKVLEMRPIDAQERTENLINFVGLSQFTTVKIDELSAGLQLRVALARALGMLPTLVVVEEPDRELRGIEMEAFRKLLASAAVEYGCAVALSTAAEVPAFHFERRVECVGGRIVCDAIP
jgi:lipoprotein-releasing system ATP-binding protein